MAKLDTLGWIILILITVGAVNWGLFGLFGLDLITYLGEGILSKIVYILVGVAGLVNLYNVLK